ncbi:hypothetical protein QBC37DRAFT_448106 [Rhypophila decipiens]|uniref:MYND-type domain-containing protein n=1 Tax=Rhypophila decipiens TaxID=261697 RepID=A0AAN6Y0S6_9PEZI|nr:hypothetical protein QBC37DRAFT_448106 [Rhypophila decipiens]
MERPRVFPRVFFGIKPQRCATCSKTSGLLLCGGCKVTSYCGREHQVSDRLKHKSICKEVKTSREKLEREEAVLRALPPNPTFPEDVFTNGVGRFWGLIETRDYMSARFGAADTLIRADTWLSVQKALEHQMDMLRLCGIDNMGIRDYIPALMIRLGQEQECYDFLKWWATCHPDGRYDSGDVSLPFLNIRNADPFEPIDPFRSGSLSLSQLSILTLLKLGLFLDLDHIKTKDEERAFGFGGVFGRPNNDSDDEFGLYRPRGNIVKAYIQQPENRRNASAMAERLEGQYKELCSMVQNVNSHFWETLVDNETLDPPSSCSIGSPEDAALAVIQVKAAWEESWGAIQMAEHETSKYVAKHTSPGASTSNAQPPSNDRVVVLCLEEERMFNAIHGHLIKAITTNREIERAKTPDEAILALSHAGTPSIILIVDGAITHHNKVSQCVSDCLRTGSTVVACGRFSSLVNAGEFNRFFSRLGFPSWTRGAYYRTNTSLRREVVGNALANKLPATYSQKTLYVAGPDRSAMWYTDPESPSATQAAAALVKVGNGKLGYIGDVNGEKETTKVVLAMCGLL